MPCSAADILRCGVQSWRLRRDRLRRGECRCGRCSVHARLVLRPRRRQVVVVVVVVICVAPHKLWAEKFRRLHEQNERISLLLCHCVAARWFESVPANRMDAQSKQVTLLVQ